MSLAPAGLQELVLQLLLHSLSTGAPESKPVCLVPSVPHHAVQPGLKVPMQAACASLQLLACQVPSAAELVLLLVQHQGC